MNMNLALDPKNRGEQIEGSMRFILDDAAYYESLKYAPNRLNACAMELFLSNDCVGYHANVIRKALQELNSAGFIDYDEPPYDIDKP